MKCLNCEFYECYLWQMARAAIKNNLTRLPSGMPEMLGGKRLAIPRICCWRLFERLERSLISVYLEFNFNIVCFFTMKFIKGMEGQVRQSSCLNLMLSMHPFPQTNFFPQLMLSLIQMVRTKQYILFFYWNNKFLFAYK